MSPSWQRGPPWAVVLALTILLPVIRAQASGRLNVSMAEFVESILSRKTYRSNVRPGIDSGKAIVVTLNIFVNSISSIDDFNMEYSMTFYLRQMWRDERLAFKQVNKTVTLNYNDLHRIWVPDLFFRNEKAGMLHDITVPNRLIRLGPDGTFLYSQRISLRLDCYMTLHKFPMDDQKCRMEIGSYGYTTEDLMFQWKNVDALNIKDNLELPEFQITSTKVGDCTRVFSTGAFACVFAEFHFDRKFEYYLLQTYIPSLLVVVLSWVSFWIDIEAVPARISLGLLTVLTMTTQASAISARLPRVSYIKGIDVWMSTCLLFVFGALIEYSAVNVMYRSYQKQDRKLAAARAAAAAHAANNESEQDDPLDHDTLCNDRGDHHNDTNSHSKEMDETEICLRGAEVMGLHKKKRYFSSCFPKGKNRAIMVDHGSRFFFPGLFVMFNLVYWILYGLVL